MGMIYGQNGMVMVSIQHIGGYQWVSTQSPQPKMPLVLGNPQNRHLL